MSKQPLVELPTPEFEEPAEDFAVPTDESQCEEDPQQRQGVLDFSSFVLNHLGGQNGGIVRHCIGGVPLINPSTGQPKPSGHYTGRAWDWMMNASDEDDALRVQKLIDWLFANNHEMWRRIGLSYLIWNRQSWSNYRKSWKDYTGSSPHTDHVHFSFGAEGADGNTSFFRWLATDQRTLPPVLVKKETHYGWLAMGVAIGILTPMGLDYAYHQLKKTPRRARRRA
jgi:hypothetical protein